MESNGKHGRMPVTIDGDSKIYELSTVSRSLFCAYKRFIAMFAFKLCSSMRINFISNCWSKFQTKNRLYSKRSKKWSDWTKEKCSFETVFFALICSPFTFFPCFHFVFFSFSLTQQIYDFVNLCICSCKMEMKAIYMFVCFWCFGLLSDSLSR